MSFISIIGSGVVGTATGKGLASHGHAVLFIDSDPARVTDLSAQGFDASLPGDVAWTDADITMVSVNTPTVGGRVNLGNAWSALATLARGLAGSSAPHVVVVRSTVPPTTTTSVIKPLLEELSGRTVGPDLGLAMNPEFLRQRNAEGDFVNPWLTVYGTHGPAEAAVLRSLYEPFGAPIVETDPTTAETIKYAHNLYNATKISFFNEFHLVAERLGIDGGVVGEVVARSAEGMWRPEYGIVGGRPYDGACLPKDTEGFLSFAHGLGLDMPLLSATIEVNETMERREMNGVAFVKLPAEIVMPEPMVDGASPISIRVESEGIEETSLASS